MARNFFARPGDGPSGMTTGTLDEGTTERLLRGALPPDDAPPGYGELAQLLQAARAEVRAVAPIGASETIAAMVAAIAAHPLAPPRRSRRPARLAVMAATGTLALFSGLTAAGALPSVAQDHVSAVLARVGIDVPAGGDEHPGSGAEPTDKSGDDTGTATTPGAPDQTNHGDCVSSVAGSGGQDVRVVAQSECGKPPSAGGPSPHDSNPAKGPPGGSRPDHAGPTGTTPPGPPSQPNPHASGGNGDVAGDHGSKAKEDKKPK
jgi:hypothetical protein